MVIEELKTVKVAVKLELMKYSTCSQRDMRKLLKVQSDVKVDCSMGVRLRPLLLSKFIVEVILLVLHCFFQLKWKTLWVITIEKSKGGLLAGCTVQLASGHLWLMFGGEFTINQAAPSNRSIHYSSERRQDIVAELFMWFHAQCFAVNKFSNIDCPFSFSSYCRLSCKAVRCCVL